MTPAEEIDAILIDLDRRRVAEYRVGEIELLDAILRVLVIWAKTMITPTPETSPPPPRGKVKGG